MHFCYVIDRTLLIVNYLLDRKLLVRLIQIQPSLQDWLPRRGFTRFPATLPLPIKISVYVHQTFTVLGTQWGRQITEKSFHLIWVSERTTNTGSLAAECGEAFVPFRKEWTRLWRLMTWESRVPSALSNPSRAFLRETKASVTSVKTGKGLCAI